VVVIVITTFHMALLIEVKSWPLASESGPSKIFKQYPNKTMVTKIVNISNSKGNSFISALIANI
jgi:hypothetical protein